MITIGVIPRFGNAGQRRLFELLAVVFDLRVEERTSQNLEGLDAAIILEEDPPTNAATIARTLNVYAVTRGPHSLRLEGANTIEFSSTQALDPILRGQVMPSEEAASALAMDVEDSCEVMARVEGEPVWTVSTYGSRRFCRSSVPLPELSAEQQLLDFLNGERFLKLLPLYHFLRRIAGKQGWKSPPLRASLIIDDPNLRSIKYGHIDYRKLLNRAKVANFHIAMATVPLDGWWVSPTAARLFRDSSQWLSLLIHGNNHTHQELAQSISPQQQISLLAEALRRIENLERRAGVKVLRTMVPPHGSCSEEFMSAMQRFEFEGCAANTGPWLWRSYKSSERPADAGLQLADILAGGLPVINRFRFNSKASAGKIAIAAFLGQPIVPYGHHGDVSEDGSDSLAQAVDRINSYGTVHWMNLRDIMETNFLSRVTDDLLQVNMFSRRIRLMIPESVRRLEVLLPRFSADAVGGIQIVEQSSCRKRSFQCRAMLPFSVTAGSEITIKLEAPIILDHTAARSGDRSLRLGLRRIASEMWDRVRP